MTNPQSFGTLKIVNKQVRSKLAQAQAGGADRRPTDDGGHYIAARFDGPTDAFNHFAQDANFNRGEYRRLEDQWARAKRAGRNVTVRILPSYDGASKRPSKINIWFNINGYRRSLAIPNEPEEKRGGK
ncbi:DNA/RNA non-specific endonuclease [Sphingomonas sp. XXL09]|uniref:DNA/RNA non-specific endonuclease n=1 Tax=Sphingomonas sp. XXL09 TaxID=3457787 RepID=UPI00406BC741